MSTEKSNKPVTPIVKPNVGKITTESGIQKPAKPLVSPNVGKIDTESIEKKAK